MKEVVMKLENVNVTFAKKNGFLLQEKYIHVLNDINLDIYQGEILAIVGESGCGKTTTGKLITGLLKPSKGKVLFIDKDNCNQRSVQFVQQDSYAALNPVNTIFDSLYSALKANHRKWKKQQICSRIDELMKMIGLYPAEPYLSKYPHQLSGGQRQRILIARALSLDPKIIVADEPVSMIDVSLRLSILNMMSTLNKELGVTFVYITHDLSTARYVANNGRICVMYLGEIVEIGDLQKVIEHPLHPYTQALLKAVPDINASLNETLPIKSMQLGDLTNRSQGCQFASRCPYQTKECESSIPLQEIDGVKVRCIHATHLEDFKND